MHKSKIIFNAVLITLFFCLIFIAESFPQEQKGREAETETADTQELADTITKSFKKAIEEIDMQKAAQRAREEERIGRELGLFIHKWVAEEEAKRKSRLCRIIEQSWQNLLSTPPEHIEYYLRDFSYSVQGKDLLQANSITYPYIATVHIRELLYADRVPLIAEPRTDYEYTATTDIKLELQYRKEAQGWQIVSLTRNTLSVDKGWPGHIRKKVGTYFIPAY